MKTKDVPNLEIKIAENDTIVMKVGHPMYGLTRSDTYIFEDFDELFVFAESNSVMLEAQ